MSCTRHTSEASGSRNKGAIRVCLLLRARKGYELVGRCKETVRLVQMHHAPVPVVEVPESHPRLQAQSLSSKPST